MDLTDSRGAARFVLGAEADDEAVAKLAAEASSKAMEPYRQGHVAALARKATCALSLALDHAIESTPYVPPQCVANHTRMLNEVAEKLGGSDAAFTSIEVTFQDEE